MAQRTDLDGLMSDLVGDTSSSAEVETMVERPQGVLNIRHADIFEGKTVKAPENWPERRTARRSG